MKNFFKELLILTLGDFRHLIPYTLKLNNNDKGKNSTRKR